MKNAPPDAVVERALEIAAFLLASLEVPFEENGPPTTAEELSDFLIEKAYMKLGYKKDSLGRWCKS